MTAGLVLLFLLPSASATADLHVPTVAGVDPSGSVAASPDPQTISCVLSMNGGDNRKDNDGSINAVAAFSTLCNSDPDHPTTRAGPNLVIETSSQITYQTIWGGTVDLDDSQPTSENLPAHGHYTDIPVWIPCSGIPYVGHYCEKLGGGDRRWFDWAQYHWGGKVCYSPCNPEGVLKFQATSTIKLYNNYVHDGWTLLGVPLPASYLYGTGICWRSEKPNDSYQELTCVYVLTQHYDAWKPKPVPQQVIEAVKEDCEREMGKPACNPSPYIQENVGKISVFA